MTAVRFSPWIVSEHVPDFSSMERMLQHPRFAGKQGQDLAVALWGLMVDRDLGLFHYIPAQNPFWKKDEYDAIKTWNVYGWSICHCHASILGAMGRAAGFKTRIANIKGHEGTEFWYDNAWHYFDGDIQMYYRKHPPLQHQIACLAEIHADRTLITEQQNPSTPSHFPDRLPEQMTKLFEVEPSYLPIQDESVHSMDFMLRPGEKMQRYFGHKGRRFVFDGAVNSYKRYASVRGGAGPAETGPEGPTERFWPGRQWGNGFLWYAPDLTHAASDFENGVLTSDNVQTTALGLQAIGTQGQCTFEFTSPYVYCGVADPMKRMPSEFGAQLALDMQVAAGGRVQIDISDAQGNWITIANTSEEQLSVDYTEHVEGRYSFCMRIEIIGSSIIRSLNNTLWFMVSPHSLPALRTVGENNMHIHHGDKFDQQSRSLLLERNLMEGDDVSDCCALQNAQFDANDYARVKPIDDQACWELIYKVTAPEDCVMSWVSVYAEFEGTKPGEETDADARIEIANNPQGPWQEIGRMAVVEHPQGWHFSVFAEGCWTDATSDAYVRFSCKKGFKGFRLNAHYCDPHIQVQPTQALEITHAWYEDKPEVGRRLCTHKQTIDGLNENYTVKCEHEPHNHFVAMEIPSTKKADVEL